MELLREWDNRVERRRTLDQREGRDVWRLVRKVVREVVAIRGGRIVWGALSDEGEAAADEHAPSPSSLVLTTYSAPPHSAANLATRSSSSSSKRYSSSSGGAPMTGGSSACSYAPNTDESNAGASDSVGAGASWLVVPLVVVKGAVGGS
jgi:hypothetical protein